MAYGLEFYGSNGQLIFDSDIAGLSFLTIEGGTISTGTNAGTINLNEEFLFARPSTSTGLLSGSSTISGSNNEYASITFTNTAKFFKAKRSNVASTIASEGTYGLEMYDTNGTTVTFSTKKAANALNIVGTAEPGRIVSSTKYGTWHTDTVYSGTTSDVYVSINGTTNTLSAGGTNYYIQAFNFLSSSIVLQSTVPGPFGAIWLPLFGQAVIADIKG